MNAEPTARRHRPECDPFKLGTSRQRPWLIVTNDGHPFADEQYVAVAVATKSYEESIPLSDAVWEAGGVARESYVSPWPVHSPRTEGSAVHRR